MTSSTAAAIAAVSSALGVMLLFSLLLLLKLYGRRTSPASSSPSECWYTLPADSAITAPVEKFLNSILQEKPIRFTAVHLAEFTRNYSVQLGSGGCGIVYRGELPNGVPVAVKLLKMPTGGGIDEQFMSEVGTIGRTNHMNLVKLYGFCFEPAVKAFVYEYLENGSLDNYLFGSGSGHHRLSWPELHRIAVGTAKGLRYLHEECQQRIVHYDVKPANVLLTTDFAPKVADFGLARFADRATAAIGEQVRCRGTPGYAAPELWSAFGTVTVGSACDVYSFGMMLFEILGRRRNFDAGEPGSREWYPRWVWERFERGEMEAAVLLSTEVTAEEREKARKMGEVALWCVQYKAEARPNMGAVVRMLEGEDQIVPPVNPFAYMDGSDARSATPWTSTTTATTLTGSSSTTTGAAMEGEV